MTVYIWPVSCACVQVMRSVLRVYCVSAVLLYLQAVCIGRVKTCVVCLQKASAFVFVDFKYNY